MKKCSKCGKELPTHRFSRDRHNPKGLRSHCKGCMSEYHKTHYLRMREYMRSYRSKFPEKHKKHQEQFYQRRKKGRRATRFEVLSHYSKGKPKCACCGEEEIVFLAIDHIDGGGRQHLRKLNKHSLSPSWYVKNNFPKAFQILCHNCNWGKHRLGKCPHLSKIKE